MTNHPWSPLLVCRVAFSNVSSTRRTYILARRGPLVLPRGKMRKAALIGMIATIFGVAFARDLPEFLHVCKRTDPNLGECMKQSIENFRPYLKAGLPDYKIPSIEPLLLKEMTATAGGNLKLKLRDLQIYGASNYSLRRIKANLDSLTFVCELTVPNLAIQGEYSADGQILLLSIRGDGPMVGNFTNCRGIVKVQLEKIKGDDGHSYLKVVDIKVKITVGTGNLKLKNLFGGDPVLDEAINTAINTNFDAFLQEIQPPLESAISNTFTEIGTKILAQFTYDVLFPAT